MLTFDKAAARLRLRVRFFLIVFTVGTIMVFASLFLSRNLSPGIGGAGVALIIAAVAIIFARPRLICPSCQGYAETFAHYCPSCGADELRHYQATAARCSSCRRVLGSYKWRDYRIRFCTNCGVSLEEQKA